VALFSILGAYFEKKPGRDAVEPSNITPKKMSKPTQTSEGTTLGSAADGLQRGPLPTPPPQHRQITKHKQNNSNPSLKGVSYHFFSSFTLAFLILLRLEPGGGSSDLPVGPRSSPDNPLVNGGLDAVVHLDVKLGHVVVLVDGGLADVTEGGGVDDVSDDEALDRLVLGDGLAGGHTAHALHVSAALLVSSVAASFYGHDVIIILLEVGGVGRMEREEQAKRNGEVVRLRVSGGLSEN